MFEHSEVTSFYSLDDALEGGVLVALFRADWQYLTGGKPIVATAAIANDISEPVLKEMWNDFASIRSLQMQLDRRPFLSITYNDKNVWILEDILDITFLYPHEY